MTSVMPFVTPTEAPARPPTGESPRPRASRLRWPLIVGGATLGGTLLLRLRDPHVPGSYGLCPLQVLFGLDCPLCGGLRATNRLAFGDVASAFDHNALFTASVPLLILGWLWWTAAALGLVRPVRWTPRRVNVALALAVGILGVFGVVRNLPGLEFLRSTA